MDHCRKQALLSRSCCTFGLLVTCITAPVTGGMPSTRGAWNLCFGMCARSGSTRARPPFVSVPVISLIRAPENYRLAKKDLAAQLGSVPFYPGIGNHEFHPESRDDQLHTAGEYSTAWDRPVRYSWTVDNILCIMLDQPNPYAPDERRENPHVVFAPETLDFLDTTLARFPERIAVVFAHCPLQNTVLDRDQERNLDEDSTDPFFYVDNSDEVRAILARHANAALYISGHTHSGWGSPNLVFTETLGSHPVTHLNLMSPWYTGKHHGPRWSADRLKLEYRPDDPDVLASFAVRIYPHSALIHMRDHRARQWLTRWTVPIL